MSKRCAKCEKIVYPVEEFRCLDKTWHKACFRCWECGMSLNMKNYKGFNKLPYCDAHYPKVKHTAVADTPENARIAQNTKLQSQVKYHEEFEKNVKGTKITVADDPETLRAMKNAEISSQIKYHDHHARQIVMERQRQLVDTEPDQYRQPAQPSYHQPPPQPQPVAQQHQQHQQHQHQQHQQHQHQPVHQPPPQGPKYRAMYDYVAADSDEVSFNEGDVIINAESIDEGWMTGTVQRTGRHGMLPANYVEKS